MITIRLSAHGFRITHIQDRDHHSAAPGRMPYAPTFGFPVGLFIGRLDLSAYQEEVRAVEGKAGRPGWEPRLLMSLWVYAYSKGVGSARAIEELCEWEPAYQWLTGSRVINAHTLSDFRVKHDNSTQRIVRPGIGAVKCRWIDHAGTGDAGRDQDQSQGGSG